ncbi:MAG: DUF2147 domain-containing protein [Sphaerochaetaceae bacterium]|jgi:uncharacterized protein (DUF2147 family)|nr:DUF2147 domain-containing protein [Sphaerochaetaceae bacterium]
MTKKIPVLIACAILCMIRIPLKGAELSDVFGYWKTVDTRKNITTSVIGIYEYNGQMYGRSVIGYDEKSGHLIDTIYRPIQRVEKLKGKPHIHTIDIVWGLTRDGDKWRGGKILDPRYGTIFDCEAWVEDNILIIRGKLGPFGVNSAFYKIEDTDLPLGFVLPNLATFVTNIPIK